MENFDAVGQWREVIRKPGGKRRRKSKTGEEMGAVDARTTLPGGHQIDGVTGLQKFLLNERREQFAHAFVHKLATYALGRSLDLSDEPQVDRLARQFAKNDHSIKSLIEEIVVSELFRNR